MLRMTYKGLYFTLWICNSYYLLFLSKKKKKKLHIYTLSYYSVYNKTTQSKCEASSHEDL